MLWDTNMPFFQTLFFQIPWKNVTYDMRKNDFYFFGIQSKLVFFPRLQRMRANFFLFRISLSCMFLLKVLLIIFYGRETIYHLQ